MQICSVNKMLNSLKMYPIFYAKMYLQCIFLLYIYIQSFVLNKRI